MKRRRQGDLLSARGQMVCWPVDIRSLAMPPDLPRILLLSELYPPTIGGSGVLLEGIYSRVAGPAVHVLTDGTGSRRQHSLDVTAIPMNAPDWGVMRPASLARHVRVARQVRRLAAAHDVVHCGRGLPEGLSALLSGRQFVCWTHGEELGYASTSRELTWLLRRVYSRASALIANSKNSAGLLREWGVEPERVSVIYPGVDTARFHPDANRSDWRARYASRGEQLLLSVGRLQRRKGHDVAIAALARWRPGDPPVRYLIAGAGDTRPSLEADAQRLGLGDRVVFLGEVPDEALPGLYAASDLFLLPNRRDGVDFEGFGIVFLEAAAAGLPCIAGQTGGAPEAIVHEATGLLVSGTDPDELATAIRRIVGSPGLAEDMGRRGRRRAVDEFTWERGARSLSALHERLTSRR